MQIGWEGSTEKNKKRIWARNNGQRRRWYNGGIFLLISCQVLVCNLWLAEPGMQLPRLRDRTSLVVFAYTVYLSR